MFVKYGTTDKLKCSLTLNSVSSFNLHDSILIDKSMWQNIFHIFALFPVRHLL